MCGIFGYYNYRMPRSRRAILECLLMGLRRQEYRGYDSAGLALDAVPWLGGPSDEEDGEVTEGVVPRSPWAASSAPRLPALPCVVVKSSGKIAELEALAYAEMGQQGHDLGTEFTTHVGIAHTRWATHGPPSAQNAHPHVSGADHTFVVVHNGIITNFKALRAYLAKKGERFDTETDTEVIPKLCAYLYRTLPGPLTLAQLVCQVMRELEGSYGLLIKSAYHPGSLVACKRGSPLILGVRVGQPAARPPSPVRGAVHANGGDGGPPSPEAVRARQDSGLESPIVSRRSSRSGFVAPPMECFLASDAAAVVEHTRRVIVLEDDDVAHIHGGGYEIYSAFASGGEEVGSTVLPPAVQRALHTLEMEVSQIQKGGYDHFMQKEIHEQPESVWQTMRGRVCFEHDANGDPWRERRITLGGLTEHLPAMRASRRLVFVGCGTSYHACLAARPTVEALTRLPCSLELASDLLDRRAPLFRDDTVFFVSQSGETADTLQALEYAKQAGSLCLGITNTVGSSIARSTHAGVHLNAGAEIGVASTKAYTSQVVALTMVALALSEDIISVRDARDVIIDAMQDLPDALRGALELDGAMARLAAELRDEQSLLVFGRGVNYATALEGALKVKEVALMHSEGILAGEMKHGPLALVDASMPILIIAARDAQYAKMLSVVEQLLARGARLYVFCHAGDDQIDGVCDGRATLFRLPPVPDALQPVVNVVPLHLLAYHLTILRGHDVDQPRNLAKSVTVSEETDAIGAGGKKNHQPTRLS